LQFIHEYRMCAYLTHAQLPCQAKNTIIYIVVSATLILATTIASFVAFCKT